MFKYIFTLLFCIIFIDNLHSQSDWMDEWKSVISRLDSVFAREQRQFRLMQSYQNEATEELIIKDIDSLIVFEKDVNTNIALANNCSLPNSTDGKNAAETLNLKVGAVKEYFEQCMLQIQVNNGILQKKLKNESLDFIVSQINELKTGNFVPMYK